MRDLARASARASRRLGRVAAAVLFAGITLGLTTAATVSAATVSPATVPPATVSAATVPPATAPFLHGLDRISTLASTIPPNGDENPYAVYVAPFTAGVVRAGDVLVDDFNSLSNEQGTGTSVLLVTPAGATRTFAKVPRHLSGCPGGIGLTTAMTMLSGGWVLVGSTPTRNGSTATAGRGCLVVISATGRVVGAIAGPLIDGPWDMASLDHGAQATLLLTNTLIGVKAPGQATVDKGDLVRLELRTSASSPPVVTSETVVASGFPERSDVQSRLVVGPTGVALEAGTAYVADPLRDDVVAIADALDRTTSAGTGRVLAAKGSLRGPLAMALAPNGDLLVTNGLNGNLVEISRAGREVARATVDPDPAQSPPGDGDLFGLAVAPGGKGVYLVKDDTNTLVLLH